MIEAARARRAAADVSAQRGRRCRGNRSPRASSRCWAMAGGSCKCMRAASGDRWGRPIIVANVNKALKPFNRKIGPDPASQAHLARIGGVVNNNSSGAALGGLQHLPHHVAASGDAGRRHGARFGRSGSVAVRSRSAHAELLDGLSALHHEVMADAELVALIREKYRIKNTVGYSINALVDFHDPIDILDPPRSSARKGTLGFVSRGDLPDDPGSSVQGGGADPVPRSAPRAAARYLPARQWRGAADAWRDLGRPSRAPRAGGGGASPPVMKRLRNIFTEPRRPCWSTCRRRSPEELEKEIALATAILVKRARPISISADGDEERCAPALGRARASIRCRGDAAWGARPCSQRTWREPVERLADFVIDTCASSWTGSTATMTAYCSGLRPARNLHFRDGGRFRQPRGRSSASTCLSSCAGRPRFGAVWRPR